MHRIEWTAGEERGTLVLPDGYCRLPTRAAEALSAYGVAIFEQCAVLLGDAGPRSMHPGELLRGDRGTVRWHPPPALSASPPALPRPSASEASLVLVTPTGETHAITSMPFLIGGHVGCDLRFGDSDVAPFHCLLAASHRAVRVIDLASTSGVYVNDTRVQQATVARHCNLRVGSQQLTLSPGCSSGDLSALRSSSMRALLVQVERVAVTSIPVLIHGESGVGKDLVARELHRQSGRSGPLVTINAATLTPTLSASELFGYVRGAFTGAEHPHEGAFVAANHGTLFLDEIAELPMAVQAKLLRVVELGKVRRLGDAHEVPVNARLVVATHRDLASRVREGRFREDLFHRLCVVPLEIPPLRERLVDLDIIADRFLAAQPRRFELTLAARKKLRQHPWTGNVRELLNTLHRACIFASDTRLDANALVFSSLANRAHGLEDVFAARVIDTYSQLHSAAATASCLGLRRGVVHRILKAHQKACRDELEGESADA